MELHLFLIVFLGLFEYNRYIQNRTKKIIFTLNIRERINNQIMNIINKKISLPKPYYESEHIGSSPLEHYTKKWNDKECQTLSINFLEKDLPIIENDWATIISSFERSFEGFDGAFLSEEYVIFVESASYNTKERVSEIWVFPVLLYDNISKYLSFTLEEFLEKRYNFSEYKNKYLSNDNHQWFFHFKYNHNILGAKVEYSSGKIPYNRNKELSYGDNKEFYVVPVKSSIRNTNGFIDLIYFIGETDLGHQFGNNEIKQSTQRFVIEEIVVDGEGKYANLRFSGFSFIELLSGDTAFSLQKVIRPEDIHNINNLVVSEILYQPKRSGLLLNDGTILIGSFILQN